MDRDRERNYITYSGKETRRIITCSACRHGMGVSNGIRYGDVIRVQSLEQDGRTNELVKEKSMDMET